MLRLIVGFLAGVGFSVLCAWIDGVFYQRSQRRVIDHARFLDYVYTLPAEGLETLRGHLDQVARQRAEQAARRAGLR